MTASEAWDMLIHHEKCLESCGDIFLRDSADMVACLTDGAMDAEIVMDRTQFMIDYGSAKFREKAYD